MPRTDWLGSCRTDRLVKLHYSRLRFCTHPSLVMMSAFAITLGASLGALLRWRLGLWLSPEGWIPWGTLAANWLGALLIGFLVSFFQHATEVDPVWRLALITGFLGALTTFSTFSAEVIEALQDERWGTALAMTALHVLGSLALTVAGLRLHQWLIAKA